MPTTIPPELITDLRQALARLRESRIQQQVVDPKAQVLSTYQPIFSAERIPSLTEETFRRFLLFENNRHWTGLHRQGTRVCSDMGRLKQALITMLDESCPISDRLDEAVEQVRGMGRNIATAILLVAYPEKYGVWNNRSEAALKRLGLWPDFEWGISFGKRYAKINQILVSLRDELATDLWTLDSLWWFLDQESEGGEIGPLPTIINPSFPEEPVDVAAEIGTQRFGLERHLHDFLRDNWNSLELAEDWAIFSEPGDDEAGYEYPTEVGRIDLLARHRSEPRWLVIELKRQNSADQTLAQVLRYMGWVKRRLAAPDEQVDGMIISRDADRRLPYALEMVPNVTLKTYHVEFQLRDFQEKS